ncbi:hypothetical protein BI364_10285 [Acidihalobacter yilgarnensis]|uniref:DUF488 domain-containing protein n=2 Tax=Acidihalobacter yilgarnensis TaxID=2819280 RepID=A0A1D8IT66_9GAMM|nr:hypothetical protein BI364_10285 [Acidihalobacter yilgarnensis]
MLVVKRVYAPVAEDDGFRVLVDRLWPRGLSKAAARIDLWAKDVAPSDALRQWFGHDPAKWDVFQHRYSAELAKNVDAMAALRSELSAHVRGATLLYAAHDEQHNNAVVLLRYLQAQHA